MEVLYRSTRGQGGEVKASQAILKGLADDRIICTYNYSKVRSICK